MNEEIARDIYWVLATKRDFCFNLQEEKDFYRLKIERVKIANRYSELKLTHSFDESERISKIEWLMNCDKQNENIK